MKFIDLTHTIHHQMPVFPGEAAPTLVRDELPDDAAYVTYRLETNMHTGTHIDAPLHAKNDTLTLDKFPIEDFVGKAVLIDVRGLSKIRMQQAWESVFNKNDVILFFTGHSEFWGTDRYYQEYPEFDTEIAEALVNSGVRIAGFDSPSPDKSPYEFHTVFLKKERFLVENLANLNKLDGIDEFMFTAFPLKLEAEASLIRAVALIA
jgi:kynurenine formamidase